MPYHEQIGQSAAHPEPLRVLRQPAVARLDEPEHSFEHPERVLNLGAHPGLRAVLASLHLIDHATMTVAFVGEVLGVRRVLADHRPLSPISLIAIDPRLLPVQQLPQHLRIMHVRRRRRHRMDQLGPAVHADVQLHTKIPLLPLARLVHLQIAALAAFLVELGAVMMVASTMVPPATFRPRDARCWFTRSNSTLPSSWRSSRWRKFKIVVSSGTGSRPRSMPPNSRIDRESYSASSAIG